MTLDELYEIFIEDKKIDIIQATVETIENRYVVISRYFGKSNISNINKIAIRKYQNYLLNECNYSVSHVNNLIGVLKQIFNFALENGYIKTNTIASVSMINKRVKIPKEKVIWNLEQFLKFNEYINSTTDKVIFNMLFFLGIRKGELLSLRWNEVSFAQKNIKIISTANREKGKGQVITPPKTVHSNRIVVMDKFLCELIEEYYIGQRKIYGKDIKQKFVIGGDKMMSFTSLQRLLKKYLAKTQLPEITLHGFRHSHATMLADFSTDIKAISERLGHENIEITLKTYIHTNSKAQFKLTKEIERNVQSHNKSKFIVLVDNIKELLRKEITENECTDIEMDQIVNLYNYVQKEVINI